MDTPEKPSPRNKILLSIGIVLVSGIYVLWQNLGGANAVTAIPTRNEQPTALDTAPAPQPISPAPDPVASKPAPVVAPAPSTPQKTPDPAPTPAPAPQTAGKFKDGAYTGDATDAFYGIVQVKAIVSGGKLVDVQFLQYPNDRATTIQISKDSMPRLTQEAIVAQSAKVDTISGATQTSEGFSTSLASALAQAS
jgi:uncharacterized protein with FMN-binding domain